MVSKNADILRRVEIFAHAEDAQLDKIGEMLKERRYRENQTIFKQGEPGDTMLIVADGRVKVFTQDGASERVLAFFGEGEVLGEMALLTGQPRSANAAAVSDVRALILSKADFDSYIGTNPSVLREMMRVIAIRQAQTNERLTRGGGETDIEMPSKGGRVYTVYSPRGGSGKTMISVNLAVAFAQMYPDQVALMDLSLTFGHCTLMLNLVPKASLAAISIESLSKMDREGINYYLVQHASTLKILAGSSRPEEGEAVTAEQVKGAVDLLKRLHTVTVIDTSSTFSEATIAAIESSDRLIVVCTPELTTLRDIRECQRIFWDLIRLPKEKVFYLMNHIFPYKVLGVEQFEQALEQEMDGELPFANDLPARSGIRGEAFAQTQPGSNIAKGIDKLAKSLQADASGTGAKQTERRGLFSRR